MMTDHELNICFLKENNEGRGKLWIIALES